MPYRFTPTAAELKDCETAEFVVSDWFDLDETAAPDFEVRLASRKARHFRGEVARVSEAVAHVERVKTKGIYNGPGPGIPTGYAFRMGQAMRRAR